MDLAALLDDEEENLKLRQINVMHASIMDLLGDSGNPLYAELHSMADHYDAMLAGTHALGNLPERTCCRDSGLIARVHKDKAQQVCQKILILYSCTTTQMLRVSMPPTSLLGAKDSYSPGKTSERLSSTGISEYFPPMCEKSSICISIGRDWRRKRTRRAMTA